MALLGCARPLGCRRARAGLQFAIAALMVGLVSLTAPTPAQADDHSSFSVSSAPDPVEARPGDQVKTSVRLSNLVDAENTYQLAVVPLTAGDDGRLDIGGPPNGIIRGTTVEPVVDLPPQQSVDVPVSVTVPTRIDTDTYLVGIAVTPIAEPNTTMQNQLRIVAHVAIDVVGSGNRGVTVSQHVAGGFHFGGTLNGTYSVYDTGATGLEIRSGVSIRKTLGSSTTVRSLRGQPQALLLSHHRKSFAYKWKFPSVGLGLAHPIVTTTFQDPSGQTVTNRFVGPRVVFVTPAGLGILVAVLIGLALPIFAIGRRVGRRRNRGGGEPGGHSGAAVGAASAKSSKNKVVGNAVRMVGVVTTMALVFSFNGDLPLSLAGSPAGAAALTAVTFTTSKAEAGDTAVRYAWSFTTATTGTLNSVAFSVPAGTGGASLTVGNNFGIGPGTAALSGTTVTYTVTTPVSIASGTPILISLDGFTNTSTPGTYASSVTTTSDGPTTSSTNVTVAANSATFTVVVGATLAFSDDTTNLAFHLSPGGTNDLSAVTNLTVDSNAASGYTLSAQSTTPTSSGGKTIPAVTSGTSSGVASGAFPADTWGYAIAAPTNGGAGTITRSGALASSQYVGYAAAAQTILSQTGPTNGDTAAVTTRVKVDISQAAGSYSANVIYSAVASY